MPDSPIGSAVATIHSQIVDILEQQGSCSVMLTGGNSAKQLYQSWADLESFTLLRGVDFYFGDERCVPTNHPESNYRLVMDTLFRHGVPSGVRINRMKADDDDLEAAAGHYDTILPGTIDLLLLSVAEDGHIASLFPGSYALRETQRRVIPIIGPHYPHQRLTITPPVITSARRVFVLSFGEQKRAVYEQAQFDPYNIETIPARLVLDRTWIFGD